MSSSWRLHQKDSNSQKESETDDALSSHLPEKNTDFSLKTHLQSLQNQAIENTESWTQLKEASNQRYGRETKSEDQREATNLSSALDDPKHSSLSQEGWRSAQLSQDEVESRTTERIERMEKKKQKRLKSIQKAKQEWADFKSKSKPSSLRSSSHSSSHS